MQGMMLRNRVATNVGVTLAPGAQNVVCAGNAGQGRYRVSAFVTPSHLLPCGGALVVEHVGVPDDEVLLGADALGERVLQG